MCAIRLLDVAVQKLTLFLTSGRTYLYKLFKIFYLSSVTLRKNMRSWVLVIFFKNEYFSFLILEEVLSLIALSVENTRKNYFYVAKHPVPF